MLSASMIGVAISLVANLLINVGLNIQKLAHAEAAAAVESEGPGAGATFCSLRWVTGLAVQLSGESGNMVAYSFAATSIIAPLGAVGLLANIYIATCFLGEPFRGRDVLGSLAAGGGAALVAVWAPSNALQMTSEQLLHQVILHPRAAYLAGVVLIGAALYMVERARRDRPSTARYLGISATFATFTIFAIKGVSLMLRDAIAQSNFRLLLSPIFISLVPIALVSGPGQIYWLNRALAVFPASSVVPTYYVFFSLSAILCGGVVYGDFDHMRPLAIGVFGAGVCACMLGVLVINSGRQDPDDDYDEDDALGDGLLDDSCVNKESDDDDDAPKRTKSEEARPLLPRRAPLRRNSSLQNFTFSPAIVAVRTPSRRASSVARANSVTRLPSAVSEADLHSYERRASVRTARRQSVPAYSLV